MLRNRKGRARHNGLSLSLIHIFNAVFQPLLEEGEQGKRRNADNENRSGIALDLVLVLSLIHI